MVASMSIVWRGTPRAMTAMPPMIMDGASLDPRAAATAASASRSDSSARSPTLQKDRTEPRPAGARSVLVAAVGGIVRIGPGVESSAERDQRQRVADRDRWFGVGARRFRSFAPLRRPVSLDPAPEVFAGHRASIRATTDA